MKPIEAFQYLFDHNLPLNLAFPFEEEKGHFITGKGICHIEKIHGSSRVTFGRFDPRRLVYYLKKSRSFHVGFDIKGEAYFCAIEKLAVSGSTIAANIPASMNFSLRRFVRVEPSLRSPVLVYVNTSKHGTVSFTVQDIAEQGLSFIADSTFTIEDTFVCGLEMPIDKRTFILSKATVVSKIESRDTYKTVQKQKVYKRDISYGLALFPHSEDVKKISLYIIKRDLDIKKKIQGEL
jgi:hypothetical protein